MDIDVDMGIGIGIHVVVDRLRYRNRRRHGHKAQASTILPVPVTHVDTDVGALWRQRNGPGPLPPSRAFRERLPSPPRQLEYGLATRTSFRTKKAHRPPGVWQSPQPRGQCPILVRFQPPGPRVMASLWDQAA